MLSNQAVLQADFILVLGAAGQHREEGGSSLSLSSSLFLGEASGDERPSLQQIQGTSAGDTCLPQGSWWAQTQEICNF